MASSPQPLDMQPSDVPPSTKQTILLPSSFFRNERQAAVVVQFAYWILHERSGAGRPLVCGNATSFNAFT
jgi:hypothetical protein